MVKIGGSCFINQAAYAAIAKSLIWFQQMTGVRILVVVSAAKGKTDRLIVQAQRDFPDDPWKRVEAVTAGEDVSAQQLLAELRVQQASAQLITAGEIDLLGRCENDPFNGRILGVDAVKLEGLTAQESITVVAGYYGLDQQGRRLAFGRNASDWIAVVSAGALGVPCIFCKDGGYIFALDPKLVPGEMPNKIEFLSWWQARLCSGSGYAFLMYECLEWARRKKVPLYFMPAPQAPDAWQIGAVISARPAEGGIFVGVRERVQGGAFPTCVTVVQFGQPRWNGKLDELALGVFAGAIIRARRSRKEILVPANVTPELVGALADKLNLLQPVA